MSHLDVVTRDKQGQWVNEVEGANEFSRSFSSREEAVAAGVEFARDDGVAIVGERPARSDGLPETTDENGMPLDNPSG